MEWTHDLRSNTLLHVLGLREKLVKTLFTLVGIDAAAAQAVLVPLEKVCSVRQQPLLPSTRTQHLAVTALLPSHIPQSAIKFVARVKTTEVPTTCAKNYVVHVLVTSTLTPCLLVLVLHSCLMREFGP